MAKEIEINSSLLKHPLFAQVKDSIIAASQTDGKEKFRAKLIEYINDSSSASDDKFFYDMLEFSRFLNPDDPASEGHVAFTTPDRLIYLNAPCSNVGENYRQWDFVYDHECLHQLWDTFGVEDKIKEKDGKCDRFILNIASDCVINDYLLFYRKKECPDGLITPEYLNKEYKITYDRNNDTQFTLYMKLLEKANELKKDSLINNQNKLVPAKVEKLPEQPGAGSDGQQERHSPQYIKGWTDGINDATSGKVDPKTFKPKEVKGDYEQGYNDVMQNIKHGLEKGVKVQKNSSAGASNGSDLPQIPWDIENDAAKGSSGSDSSNDSADDSAKKAQDAANDAQDASDKAKDKAQKSGSKQDQKAADDAQKAADEARKAARDAKNAADKANKAKDNGTKESATKDAASMAKKAQDAAEKAKEAAGMGADDELRKPEPKNASEAQAAADEAKKAADDAQKAANEAKKGKDKDVAKKAQKAADEARKAARDAQSAADEAKKAKANGDSDAEKKAAKKAGDEASKAKDAAEKVQQIATDDGKTVDISNPGEAPARDKRPDTSPEYGTNNVTSTVDMKKLKEKADKIIEKYRNKIAGDFGKFISQCKAAFDVKEDGLAIKSTRGVASWKEKMDRYVNAYVKKKVFQKKREWQLTYSRVKRGSGFVKFGEPIQPGKKVREEKLTINVAFYVDRSGSMDRSINHAFKAAYLLGESLKKHFSKETVVDKLEFKMYAFDYGIHELAWGKTISASGGNMSFPELMNEINKRTKDYMINIIITDAGYDINKKAAAKFVDELGGMLTFITNVPAKEVEELANEKKTNMFYVLASPDFSF